MGWGVMNDFIENKRVIGGYGVERKSLLDIKEGLIETILLLSSWYNSHFLYNPAHTIPRVLLVFVGLYRSFPPSSFFSETMNIIWFNISNPPLTVLLYKIIHSFISYNFQNFIPPPTPPPLVLSSIKSITKLFCKFSSI